MVRLKDSSLSWGAMVLLLIVFSSIRTPEAAGARPGPENSSPLETVKLNKDLSRELSKRLSDEVVVYETEWFQIIASKGYEKRLLRDVNESVAKAVAEFRSFFQVGPEPLLWKGKEKGRLVLLKSRRTFKYYTQIFKKEAQPERLNPEFVFEVQDAQSFYWVDPWPYAVCCGEGAEFDEMTQHLFHLLGHILLTCYEFNYKFAPAWLHEGYGIHMAVRYSGSNILFCTAGLNNCLFGTGVFKGLSAWARSQNWPGYFKQSKQRDAALHFDELNRLPINEFTHQDAALAWSFVTYLLETYPDEVKKYIQALKKQPRELEPGNFWPPMAFAAESFQEAFGMSFREIEPLWEEWAENYDENVHSFAATSGAGEAGARAGAVTFDPAVHLEGFTELEGEGPAVSEALATYLKRTDERLTPEDLEAMRAEWEGVRARLVAEIERLKNDKLSKAVPGLERALAELRSSREARFLEVEEVTELFWPGLSPQVFHAVVNFLTMRYGCYGAHVRLQEAFAETMEVLTDGPFKEELALLDEAARMETRLFTGLADARAAFKVEFWPAKVTLASATEGEFVLRSKKTNGTAPTLPEGYEVCRLVDRGKEVEIHCPWSYLSLKTLFTQSKSTLKMKSESDRLGYLLLCLFRGDENAFEKEARYVKDAKEDAQKLAALLPAYTDARTGALLIGLLAGGLDHNPDAGIEKLSELIPGIKGSDLFSVLQSRCEAIVQRVLLEQYLLQNRYLRSYKGFRGVEDDVGTARFVYEFKDPAELDDFDPLRGRFLDSLKVRNKVEQQLAGGVFAVDDKGLFCIGMDALTHRPVFEGDMDLVVRLRLSRMGEEDSRRFFFTLIGYGLNEEGAFVASNCLTRLEIQTPSERVHQMLEAGPDEPILGRDETCTIHLKGTRDKIVHELNDAERWIFEMDGRRKGRVFLWVYGPWRFDVELMEVTGRLDPTWLEKSIEEAVEKDMEGIFQGE